MKKWGLLVSVLYGLIFFFSFGPVMKISYWGTKEWKSFDWFPHISSAELLQAYSVPLILIVAQVVFLSVSVRTAERRPVGRRSIMSTAIASVFMMGLLAVGMSSVLLEIFCSNNIDNELWKDVFGLIMLVVFILSWVFWGFVFYRWSKKLEPANFVEKLCRYLFGGSILELLIAVPLHIIARQRPYCCAGFMTFMGIACGLAVMVFSFGPGVFFLFIDKWKRLHPHRAS